MTGLIRDCEVRCIKCGYDLRASDSLRCPECGHMHTPKDFDVGRRFTAETDRYIFRCVLVVPIVFTCAFCLAFVAGSLFDFQETASLLLLIGALSLIAAMTAAVLGACRTAQHDLVGRPQPSAFKRHPFRWVFTMIVVALALIINQVLLAGIFTLIASAIGNILMHLFGFDAG